MSKDYKSNIYYLVRRGWHDQLAVFCDGITQRKGKDPVSMFWKGTPPGETPLVPARVPAPEPSAHLLSNLPDTSFNTPFDTSSPLTLASIRAWDGWSLRAMHRAAR
jgi:hypothetical protein